MTVRGPALLALSLVFLAATPPVAVESQLAPHSREAFVMGTRVSLTTYAESRADGLQRLERMLEAIEGTDAELSTWRPDSDVSRLNAAAGDGPQPLTPTMCRVMSDVGRQVVETGGAFDPAIGSLVQAWDLHGGGRVAAGSELARARAHS